MLEQCANRYACPSKRTGRDSPPATYPASQRTCVMVAAVLLLSCLVVWASAPTGEKVQLRDTSLTEHVLPMLKLNFAAAVTELCFMFARAITWTFGGDLAVRMDSLGFMDSLLTCAEYAIKVCYSLLTANYNGYLVLNSPPVPTLLRSQSRPVICPRILGWTIAIPLLLLMVNRSFAGQAGEYNTFLRSAPSMLVTAAYCSATLLMVITHSVVGHWWLFLLIVVGFLVSCWDQIVYALEFRAIDSLWKLKLGLILWQQVMFAVYAVVFFGAHLGLISAVTEQVFYAYADCTVKVATGALIQFSRHAQDMISVRDWFHRTQAAKNDLERVITMACVPMASIDLHGKVVAWNSSLEEMTGLMSDDMLQQQLADVVTPDCKQDVISAISAAIEKVDTVQDAVEVHFQKNEDTPKSVSMIRFVPQISELGTVTHLTLAGYDLTQVCLMKASEENKNRLMGVVAHELRSPLHGMIGLAQAMEVSAKDEASKRQLNMIRNCSSRLLDLVTNAMDLSHAEQQRGANAVDKFNMAMDLRAVVEEVYTMASMAVDKIGKPILQPEVELKETASLLEVCPVVLGNQPKCIQLVYNLVINALKFTDSGSVSIQLSHNEAETAVDLKVADTGSGISPEFQKHMFDPFQQENGHVGDSRRVQGVGLGLSVVKAIAEQHKAKIRVESVLKVGTSFTISFPCESKILPSRQSVDLTMKSQRTRAHLPSSALPTETETNSTLVLTVDDDAINQEVVKSALQCQNMEVACAMDGKQALDFMHKCSEEQKRLPDIVLLDIQMPGMTGYEVLKQIRKKYEASQAKLPVIMLSAKAPAELTHLECLETGAADFLAKPFDSLLLCRKMAVALQTRREILQVNTSPAQTAGSDREAKLQAQVESLSSRLQRKEQQILALEEMVEKARKTQLDSVPSSPAPPISETPSRAETDYCQLLADNDEQKQTVVRLTSALHYQRTWTSMIANQLQAMSEVPLQVSEELMIRPPAAPRPLIRRPRVKDQLIGG
eukprot:TRINITY_DN25715_c0_g1_i1.p1 TRINITY_DN25715_c0_g1~~TRINITY_DN25715_c0_g1_i1.p1  ORF type:complete len:1004 (-),score=179.56 TRINITY_DN25715_c0_g1_i1:133-3144(-)